MHFVVSHGLQLDNPILNYGNLNGLRLSVWRPLLPVPTMNLILLFFNSGLWQVTFILAFSSCTKIIMMVTLLSSDLLQGQMSK